jgi:hypothetical protein
MEKKILVKGKEERVFIRSLFDGNSPEEVIDEIVKLSNGLEGEKHIFEMRLEWGGNEESLFLTSYRFETDKEYERRLKAEEKAKEKKAQLKKKQQESEKKEYERLKKKYGENEK